MLKACLYFFCEVGIMDILEPMITMSHMSHMITSIKEFKNRLFFLFNT